MAKAPEIPQTDPAEIEILIERLKDNKLEKRDVELIERLLRTVMVLVGLLQRKNMSIKRLRDLIFGRHTEKWKAAGKAEEKPEGNEAIDAVRESDRNEKSQRDGRVGCQRTRTQGDESISWSAEGGVSSRTIQWWRSMSRRRLSRPAL